MIDYKEFAISSTDYIDLVIHRLNAVKYIIEHFDEDIIQDIVEFKGKRETIYYDTDYTRLLDKVWIKVNVYSMEEPNYIYYANNEILSDVIVYLSEKKKDRILKIKIDKLNTLKKDIEKLEKEIEKEA